MEQIERALAIAREQRHARTSPRSADFSVPSNVIRPGSLIYSRTRVVGVLPWVLERNRVVASQLAHPVADIYRSLRAQVLQKLTKGGKTTLGITSVGQYEGKTLTAVNLALAISMDVNQTVLLVDADLRNPGVHLAFGIEPSSGLSDYLQGIATIPDCLVNPGMKRLVILPGHNSLHNSAELLSSPQMAALARELKTYYPDRLIIYDLPPLLSVGDTIGFLPNVEATLLVIRDGAVRSTELQQAVGLLANHGLIGTVLNAAV